MATIIDSLIVELGLSTKDVDAKAPGVRSKLADLEKAAGKTESGVKGIGKASKDTAGELTNLTAKMGSFLALIGGTVAVRSFLKDTIETNTQLYFLSRNLEMSTQKLFAWGAAAQEIGGSNGSVQNFMRTIASMPGELLLGRMPQLLPLFARLGINFREPFDQIMVDLSKRFAGMDRKVAFSFGIASGIPEDVMNLLLQGPGAVQSSTSRTARFAPSGAETASAAQLKRQFTDLELLIVKIGYDILYKVTPGLETFLDYLQKIGDWAKSHETIVAIIAGVATGLAAIAGLAAGLAAVSLAWGALMGAMPVLAVVGVVTALAGALVLLWQDYKVWSEGGKSFFDWTAFSRVIKSAADEVKNLAQKFEDAYAAWYKFTHRKDVQSVASAVGGVITGSSAYGLGQKIREKADLFMAGHSSRTLSRDEINGFILDAIFTGEGFNDHSKYGQNIPQRAHNPGDIEYGEFAKSHGATGYVLAEGGKKIATFADDNAGKAAARALLNTKGYAGLSPEQTIARWQTGSSIISGVPNASQIPSSVSSSTSSSSTSTDNSRVTNIGTINLQSPSGSQSMTPTMARGMDWTTLLTQENGGLQ